MRKLLSWRQWLWAGVLCSGVLMFSCIGPGASVFAKTGSGGGPSVDADDIAGRVMSKNGAEAGVWVIARASSSPTNYVKIVVTDDKGRYLIPDLPKGDYQLWVRGYGLLDSEPLSATPGTVRNLTAKIAPNPKEAAEYYPSNYWLSLLQFPPESDFPGASSKAAVKYQGQWINGVKNGCEECHQLGDKATREIPASLGHFDSSAAAWRRRINSGQVGPRMNENLIHFGLNRAISIFADWTDRIAAGEYPKEVPPRPQGIERNLVITEWDWGTAKDYFHDLIATDRRNPTVNANGLIYGVHEDSASHMTFLDPVNNTTGDIPIPYEEGTPFSAPEQALQPSPNWGTEQVWTSRTKAFSLVMDSGARVWVAATGRPPDNPSFCKQGSKMPSAAVFPLDQNGREVYVYDPSKKQFTFVNLCFRANHMAFAVDGSDTLWFSGGSVGNVLGWLDTKQFDRTHDAETSQGWTVFVLDTNGNGKRDDFVEPGDAVQDSKDKRIRFLGTAGPYSISPNPVDGSVWGSLNSPDHFPGAAVRVVPGIDPPKTALTEVYELPWMNPKTSLQAYGPRIGDIDRKGVFWEGATSGSLTSFDRRKCKGPLAGPNATGQQCPEGWTLYPFPGPKFKGTSTPSDFSYTTWVDQFNTLGLGDDVPIAIGNGSDSLLVLNQTNGKFVTLRVPYPMGFFAKNVDGRIDDPKGGWKGRGVWSTYAMQSPQHIEGGKGTTSKVVKFQLRPNPLAK